MSKEDLKINKCSIKGCLNLLYKDEYCKKHHLLHQRFGLLQIKNKVKKDVKICYMFDCSNVSIALGLCSKHYRRYKRHGDPSIVKKKGKKNKKLCQVNGCFDPYLAKGFCKKHYYRFKKHGDPLIVMKNNIWKYSSGDSQ